MDHDMTMTTTTPAAMTGMSMTMTSGSSMPSSTGGMDMGMDMGGSSIMMSSAEMAMVFFQSVTTPLYSSAWTPQGQGSYAGTCIFIIMLALLHRILIALRSIIFDSNPGLHRHAKVISSSNSDDYPGVRSDLELMDGQFRAQWNSHPFKVATETFRALLEVIIGGIGYLLMLAVMTMNVGYFLSVLGGIFLGTFVAGRFGAGDNHH
ncbi:Ctr copper transporter family-domain-containing protein [Daldinia grandis]|nr:Ctr copper transporter family-domain-containing protein [Daldinia grandis]